MGRRHKPAGEVREDRITASAQLPEWFKTRAYEKQLSPIQWFRELRLRQKIKSLVHLGSERSSPAQRDEEHKAFLLDLVTGGFALRPDSPIYWVRQTARPVGALTASEALYFRAAIR